MSKAREHLSLVSQESTAIRKVVAEPLSKSPRAPQPRARFSVEHRLMLDLLIAARHHAGLSQASLAQKLGKAQSHVAAVEVGGRDISGVEVFRWCRAVGLPFAEFARRFEARFAESVASTNAVETEIDDG